MPKLCNQLTSLNTETALQICIAFSWLAATLGIGVMIVCWFLPVEGGMRRGERDTQKLGRLRYLPTFRCFSLAYQLPALPRFESSDKVRPLALDAVSLEILAGSPACARPSMDPQLISL